MSLVKDWPKTGKKIKETCCKFRKIKFLTRFLLWKMIWCKNAVTKRKTGISWASREEEGNRIRTSSPWDQGYLEAWGLWSFELKRNAQCNVLCVNVNAYRSCTKAQKRQSSYLLVCSRASRRCRCREILHKTENNVLIHTGRVWSSSLDLVANSVRAGDQQGCQSCISFSMLLTIINLCSVSQGWSQ